LFDDILELCDNSTVAGMICRWVRERKDTMISPGFHAWRIEGVVIVVIVGAASQQKEMLVDAHL
jgi:hypothetical protein